MHAPDGNDIVWRGDTLFRPLLLMGRPDVLVVIEGFNLPGRRCGLRPEGGWYENIHVGVCHRGAGLAVVPHRPWSAADVVPGDAETARWQLRVQVRRCDGTLDFAGPYVLGRRGERYLALAWGEVGEEATFGLFRAAKLRLGDIDPTIVEPAERPGAHLVGRLSLTNSKGAPVCASVRPPDITWSSQ